MILHLEPEFVVKRINPLNGQFLKGHVPYNKGKEMELSKREKVSKTWFKKGNMPKRKPQYNQPHNKSVEMWHDDKVVGFFISISEAARKTGIERRNISNCIQNKRKTAGGFKWIKA